MDRGKPPLLDNFARAYKIGMADASVLHNLPILSMEEGSLLNEKYRFKSMEMRESEPFKMAAGAKPDMVSSLYTTPHHAELAAAARDELAKQNAWKKIPPEPAPKLTPGIVIRGELYPGGNVKKLEKMGKVCATVTMGGNDFVIGTCMTQYEADAMVRAALASDDDDDDDDDDGIVVDGRSSWSPLVPKFDGVGVETVAKILEIESIHLETIVASFHKDTSKTTKKKFSIHEWALQQMKYKDYLQKVIASKNSAASRNERGSVDCNLGQVVVDTENPYRKRKRRVPRRVRHGIYEVL